MSQPTISQGTKASLVQRIQEVVASAKEDEASRHFKLASRVHDHLSRTIFGGDPDHPVHEISAIVLSQFQEKQTEQQSIANIDLPTNTDTQLDTGMSTSGKSTQPDGISHDTKVPRTKATKATQAEFEEVYRAYQDVAEGLWDEIISPRTRDPVRRHGDSSDPAEPQPELKKKVHTIFDELERLHAQGVSLG